MSNTPIRPGYVPVTIELPADLAEKFRQQNYNWQPLIELIGGDCSSPFAIAETLFALFRIDSSYCAATRRTYR